LPARPPRPPAAPARRARARPPLVSRSRRPEQIRRIYNIRNDFTPEEEAQIIEENKWAEEA